MDITIFPGVHEVSLNSQAGNQSILPALLLILELNCFLLYLPPPHLFIPVCDSRGDGVDLLVQHRPPRRERGLRAPGSDPILLQGEGLRTAHGHGGSNHRLGASCRHRGGGALQPGERFLVHQQGAAQRARVLQLPRPLPVSLR